MPQLIAGLAALYLLLMAIRWFGRVTPAHAARLVRGGGYALGIVATLLLMLRGSLGLSGLLASFLFARAARGGGNPLSAMMNAAGWGGARKRESVARSAALLVRLDRDTGRIEGEVTAGPYAGRALGQMTRADCLDLHRWCLGDDPEGAALLEAYLDRRFAGWREAEQRDGDGRAFRGGGALTRDEAYEVLGLPQGAGRDDIVAAHRRLMKKLHPDHGGTTALAARVNQAKDILLG